MNTSRRRFIRNGSLTAAGTLALPQLLQAAKSAKEMVGIQLYSVRDDMTADPVGTLKKVAAAGYKNVEHANYVKRKFYGYSPTEFKKILTDMGMKMPSGHTVMRADHWDAAKNDFTDEWKYTVDEIRISQSRF